MYPKTIGEQTNTFFTDFSILAWVNPVERVQRSQPQYTVSTNKIKVVIVFMTGVFFALESHGAGVHNWNLYYADYIQVKYISLYSTLNQFSRLVLMDSWR